MATIRFHCIIRSWSQIRSWTMHRLMSSFQGQPFAHVCSLETSSSVLIQEIQELLWFEIPRILTSKAWPLSKSSSSPEIISQTSLMSTSGSLRETDVWRLLRTWMAIRWAPCECGSKKTTCPAWPCLGPLETRLRSPSGWSLTLRSLSTSWLLTTISFW